MKRNRLATSIGCLLLLLSIGVLAQEPPANLNGDELKQWLKINFYDGKHTGLGYSGARLKMYSEIDNMDGRLTCVYSGYQLTYQSSMHTNPAPINCEHTVPQSFFDKDEPMKSDLHHLFPTYDAWNSKRASYPFSEIDDNLTSKWMYQSHSQSAIPTAEIELYSEFYSNRFEPREDHKGDCARAIFYFFTMYPTAVSDMSRVADVNMLYQWHLNDPVDQKERDRNAAIIQHQGNSNPYVEYPDLVQRAWNIASTGPNVPVLEVQSTPTEITLNWNDITDELGYKIFRSTDEAAFVELADLNANVVQYKDQSPVQQKSYAYYIVAYNSEGNSDKSNTVSATLINGSNPTEEELFISEYVEGASLDKAIEIANLTGHTIDLSSFSLKKQINGRGAWADELPLSGSMLHGDVLVICHSGASAEIQAVADLSTNSGVLSFNGNDPIGLFKNGVLIDVIGTYNSSSYFGKDATLIRKISAQVPSQNFSITDWDKKAKGTIASLGHHNMGAPATESKSANQQLILELNAYPIPARDWLNIEVKVRNVSELISCKLVNASGSVMYSSSNKVYGDRWRNRIRVSDFNKGIYFLSVSTDNNSLNKKIIIR